MENKNNKVLLTVIGAATLLVAMVGATFAYFSATGNSDSQQITTGSSSLEISANKNAVTNIKPTTFDKATVDTNTDVVAIDLTVSGNSTSAGKYTVTMNEPAITIKNIEGDSGLVADIKYAVYEGDTQKVAPTSFTGTETDTDILTDVAYTAGDITGSYTVYVWIDNKDADQNNLQDVSFNVQFTADATASL